MNKRGLEFSFGWIFAAIVGGAIIFLAIYAAVRIATTERTVQDTEIAKQLEGILTPIETGGEEAKSATPIVFPSISRVYNNCTTRGNFGEQKMAVATSRGLGQKWQEPGFESTSYNKYLFSSSVVEGKEVYVFSKPFDMPFKVANILFMWTDKYCFVTPPIDIEDEIKDLNLRNINITGSILDCEKNSKKVCFDTTQVEACEVVVDTISKTVTNRRAGKSVSYEGDSLVYGAIFAEPDLYECQVKRLMRRTSQLSTLYRMKSEEIAARADGCSSNLQGELNNFAQIADGVNSSGELRGISVFAESLKDENDKITTCKLWAER